MKLNTLLFSGDSMSSPSLDKIFPRDISESIIPRVAIVMVTEGASSILSASKKPINAALLAWKPKRINTRD